MDNLGDRFQASAARWGQEIAAADRHKVNPILRGTLDEQAAWINSGRRSEKGAVALAALHLLASDAISWLQLDLFDLEPTSESPIEWPMLLALMVVGRRGASVKVITDSGHEHGDRYEPFGRVGQPHLLLRIEPQAQLGEHRVDFCLTLDGTLRADDGSVRSGTKRMVIECDGHDFHERTKAQARQDRERDRNLQSFGFLVYRYTGQEIWEHVFGCAAQAIDSLTEPVRAALSASAPPAG